MDTIYSGKISDIVVFNRPANLPKSRIDYLDTGNITSGVISEIQKYNSVEEAPSRARRVVNTGDIIYSTVRPNQKHFGFIDDKTSNLIVSTGFTVISPNRDIVNARYLYYYLSQNEIINYLQSLAEQRTSAYPSITISDIGDLKISLPNLDSQNQIVAILDSIDNAIRVSTKINDYLAA